MKGNPRVVIGIPVYNHATKLSEALESLLIQTYSDFALLVTDDCSTDETEQMVRGYAARDDRVLYHRNTERLGYVRNARHCFNLTCNLFPDARYFAWGSDHDVWHPRWLAEMVDALESDPNAVLAWPRVVRIDGDGKPVKKRSPEFDSTRIEKPLARLRATIINMSAGNMIYGLFRLEALRAAGVLREVLLPDRLLMVELALYGRVKQVPEYLWYRRYIGLASLTRQRRTLFPGKRPFYVYLPVLPTHIAFMLKNQVLRTTPEGLSRRTVLAAVLTYAYMDSYRIVSRWPRILIKRVMKPWIGIIRKRAKKIGKIGKGFASVRPRFGRTLFNKTE